MKKLINYLKAFTITIIIIIISSLIISLLYNYDLINDKIYTTLKMIIPTASILIGGIYIGRRSTNKGYLEGIKSSLIYLIFSFIISFILNSGISLNIIIYYIIMIISSSFGSMIGILKQKKD